MACSIDDINNGETSDFAKLPCIDSDSVFATLLDEIERIAGIRIDAPIDG